MNSHCETTQSKITSPDVFRHTPYEHETTTDTDTDNPKTTIEPVTVTTVRSKADDQAFLVQSLATTTPGW
jgi:hypothetical protein